MASSCMADRALMCPWLSLAGKQAVSLGMVAWPARYRPRLDTGLTWTAKPSRVQECVPERQKLIEVEAQGDADGAALAGHRFIGSQQFLLVGVEVEGVVLALAGDRVCRTGCPRCTCGHRRRC